jgi:hypothetical protein
MLFNNMKNICPPIYDATSFPTRQAFPGGCLPIPFKRIEGEQRGGRVVNQNIALKIPEMRAAV